MDIALLTSVLASGTLLTIDNGGQFTSLAAIGFGTVIYCAARSSGKVGALLGARPMLLLGGASYSIYLLQGKVHWWVTELIPGIFGKLVFWPALILVAIIVFLYVEEPARRYLRTSRRSTANALEPQRHISP